MKATQQVIKMAFQYGSLVLLVAAVLNVYCVMRYIELARNSTKADEAFQQYALRQQALQGVLREFAARASTDSTVLGILQRAQAATQPPAASSPAPAPAGSPTNPKATFP